MAIAAPALFALAGYAGATALGYGAYATVAMSVGWLIGSWLFGPGSGGTGQGMQPQKMPSVNQALRGTPIFVSFGTNRISAQVVWTKNYNAIRHSLGGGKGGGSGGLGGMKGGGSSGVFYTYTWDLIFHFGMVDEPAYIHNGWIGGDKLDTATTVSLMPGYSDQSNAAGLFTGSSVTDHIASLSFTEAFYTPGFRTGDPLLQSWTYWQVQEGADNQWPNTVTLGLKTLDLGQSPFLPQLSLEIGPVGGTFEADQHFYSIFDVTDGNGVGAAFDNPISMMMIGLNGKRYNGVTKGTTGYLYGIDDHSIYAPDATAFRADILSEFGIVTGASPRQILVCPCTEFFYVMSYALVLLTTTTRFFALRYKIGVSGAITFDGGVFYEMTGQDKYIESVMGVNVITDLLGTRTFYVAASQNSGPDECLLFKLPLVGTVFDVSFQPDWPASIVTHLGFDNGFFKTQNLTGARSNFARAAILEQWYDGDLAPSPGVLCYVGQSEINAATGVAMVDNATQPFFAWSIGPGGWSDYGSLFNCPFSDILTLYDGSVTTNDNNDYTGPSAFQVDGVWYVALVRGFTDKGEYARLRLFRWNNGTPNAIINSTSQYYDSVVNAGAIEATRNNAYSTMIHLGWDQTNRELILQAIGANGAINGDYVYARWGFGSVSTFDVTPPYIIYKILTSDIYGFSIPTTKIDLLSYGEAVSYCEDQGIYISVTYTTQDNFLSIVEELLSLYGGYLIDSDGIISFGVVRGASDAPDSVAIDNTRLLIDKEGMAPVTITKGALQDGYNIVKMNFLDRAIDYKQNQIELSDEVDVDINGPRVREFPGNYVMTGSLASTIAERALWSNMYGRDIFTFKLGAKDAHRKPGDVITLIDSFHHELNAGVTARITRIVESKRLEFDVQAVAVIDYQATATRDYTQTLSISNPGLTQPIAPTSEFRMYELPKEFQGASAKVYVGYNQQSAVMGAQLHESADGSNFVMVQDMQPYIISGKIAGDLPVRPVGFFETDQTIYLMPGSLFTVDTPTFCQTVSIDDVSQVNRAAGAGILIIGSEAIAIENLTLVAQNRYRVARMYRGWGGTPISNHSSGDYWHYHAAGIFSQEISEDKVGTILYYKVVPYNFSGQGYNISSISARTYQIKGLYWLPRIQPPLRVYVNSAVSWPISTSIGETTHLKVVAGGCDTTLTWPAAANNEGFGAGGFGIGGDGHFAADILTPSYRVDVYSLNGSAVSSFVVNTGYFNYDINQNSTDFNGFARNARYKVTPFNVKGDGPVSSTRTLELFW